MLSAHTTEYPLAEAYVPVAALPHWNQAMRRAVHAQQTGQLLMAQANFRHALSLARELLPLMPLDDACSNEPHADACVSAWVGSHRGLAELLVEEGCMSLAASTLAQAHIALLAVLQHQPCGSSWHRAAAWHMRLTHAALMAHWVTHGHHADIDRAVRAGCMTLTALSQPSGGVH